MRNLKKLLVLVVVMTLMASAFVGCQQQEASGAADASEAIDVAVIIKATSSDFWQYLLIGAENYGKVHPNVNVTTHGPATEAEINEQVTILEDVIATSPDVIVIASTSSDATVKAIEDAKSQGIVVITVDNKVNTNEVDSFLATDNLVGGATAADQLVASMLEKQGVASAKDLKGKIAIISSMAGVQVLIDRDTGFENRMKEIAPGLEFVETQYINNDMAEGVAAFEGILDANDDVIGVFGDNNTSGNAVAKVLSERGRDDIAAVAYDSDEAEVQAVKDGWLQGIVVQDPYRMGYDGVEYGLQALAGLSVPDYLDTGAVLITSDNINDGASQGLLDPRTRALD